MNATGLASAPAWISPFQRVTSRGDFVAEIDGLRFFALAGVFLLHLNHAVVHHQSSLKAAAQSLMTRALEGGAYGVQLFFVISGFILALPFARQHLPGGRPVSLRGYYLRRLTRLEPPLLINITLLFALKVLLLGTPALELAPHYPATCTYTHWLFFGANSPINGVTWSLEVEAQFYLLMPLLAKVFTLRSTPLRRGVILAAIIGLAACSRALPHVSLPAQLPHFLSGFLLADFWLREWSGGRKPRWLADLTGFFSAAALIAVLFWNRQIPGSTVLAPLLLLAFCLSALNGRLFTAFLRHWLPVSIGGICYTFYLYHVVLLSAITRLTARWIDTHDQTTAYALHFAVATPLILIACFLLFAVFERPFMAWRPRWSRPDA